MSGAARKIEPCCDDRAPPTIKNVPKRSRVLLRTPHDQIRSVIHG